jgi:hypothetical protein
LYPHITSEIDPTSIQTLYLTTHTFQFFKPSSNLGAFQIIGEPGSCGRRLSLATASIPKVLKCTRFGGEKMNYEDEITEDYGYGKIGSNFGNGTLFFVPFVPIVGKVGMAGGRFRQPDREAQTDNPIIEHKFKSVKAFG